MLYRTTETHNSLSFCIFSYFNFIIFFFDFINSDNSVMLSRSFSRSVQYDYFSIRTVFLFGHMVNPFSTVFLITHKWHRFFKKVFVCLLDKHCNALCIFQGWEIYKLCGFIFSLRGLISLKLTTFTSTDNFIVSLHLLFLFTFLCHSCCAYGIR